MKLRSGLTFWQALDPATIDAPPLAGDVRCEVAVLGAGITGALVADHLTRHGVDTLVVNKRPSELAARWRAPGCCNMRSTHHSSI